jgi:DNA-binding response OmpR family regulator
MRGFGVLGANRNGFWGHAVQLRIAEAGMDDYMSKPLRVNRVFELIREIPANEASEEKSGLIATSASAKTIKLHP